MKRHITPSLLLTLSLLISLVSSPLGAQAQPPPERFRFDTGIITLGPNQVLRVTVATGDVNGDNAIAVRFRRMGYIEQGNIYKVAAQVTTAPVMLGPGEGAFVDIPSSFLGGLFVGVRGMVLSSSPDVRVTAQIVDTDTGKVVAMVPCNSIPTGTVTF